MMRGVSNIAMVTFWLAGTFFTLANNFVAGGVFVAAAGIWSCSGALCRIYENQERMRG